MLGMLMLLRLPRTRVIYLTSQPIPESDHRLLPASAAGRPGAARARPPDLACLLRRQRPAADREDPGAAAPARRVCAQAIGDPAIAHIAAYTVSGLERTLAVRLGVPLYGCDPALQQLGSKSGGRQLMREAGVAIPDGVEDLSDEADIAAALADLKARDPGLRRAVVKLNEGFSGEGNAVFRFDGAPAGAALRAWIAARAAANWASRRAA